jgi:hypothetical protein
MKPKPKLDDPEQSKRFIKTAEEIGAKEDPDIFEKAFKKVVKSPIPSAGQPKIRKKSSHGR